MNLTVQIINCSLWTGLGWKGLTVAGRDWLQLEGPWRNWLRVKSVRGDGVGLFPSFLCTFVPTFEKRAWLQQLWCVWRLQKKEMSSKWGEGTHSEDSYPCPLILRLKHPSLSQPSESAPHWKKKVYHLTSISISHWFTNSERNYSIPIWISIGKGTFELREPESLPFPSFFSAKKLKKKYVKGTDALREKNEGAHWGIKANRSLYP